MYVEVVVDERFVQRPPTGDTSKQRDRFDECSSVVAFRARLLGVVLNTSTIPATSSLSFLCINRTLLSFSPPLVPFFLLGLCDVYPARHCVELREVDGYDIL